MSAVLQEATAAAESVVAAAEQEAERHRQQCDCEEAALQEQVTQEAEACRRENQGIDVDWDRLQVWTRVLCALCGAMLQAPHQRRSAA